MNSPRLKTALVTGASGGIGKSIAEQFAMDSRNVVIVARNLPQLQSQAREWSTKYGVTVTPLAADLTAPGAAQALAAELKERGIAVDYLVNNAGYGL